MSEDPPILNYATTPTSWADEKYLFRIDLHPPPVALDIIFLCIGLAVAFVPFVVVASIVVTRHFNDHDLRGDEFLASAIMLIGFSLIAARLFRELKLRSKFARSPINVSVRPGELQISYPAQWRPPVRIWTREEVRSVVVEPAGWTFLLEPQFRLVILTSRQRNWLTRIRFASRDREAAKLLPATIQRYLF